MDKLSLWTTGWRLGLLTIFILVLSYLYFQKRRQDEVRYSFPFSPPWLTDRAGR